MILNPAAKAALLNSFEYELDNVLKYWSTYTIDTVAGGFYGAVDNENIPDADTIKGSVLNARILWSFSAAYNLWKKPEHLQIAKRALDYIVAHFIDTRYGGVYWSVNSNGEPADTKKQIYGIAFTIYGLAEYYKATQDNDALKLAIKLYNDIEQHSFDTEKGGYLEAFTAGWNLIGDLRLSDKDANEKKTMNTHLHVLEAYTTLYQVWPDEGLNTQIRRLIACFEDHIVDSKGHLVLFFDEDWQVKSNAVSYGHDIEASWLLQEAAEVLHDEELTARITTLAVKIAKASAEGLNADGSMNYEYEPNQNHLISERHWWVQAEAVVGYYNAYQNTGEHQFFNKAAAVWTYTRQHLIDNKKGEWFWGINDDGSLMDGYGKVGLWKCPYHNSRACIEMIKRLRG